MLDSVIGFAFIALLVVVGQRTGSFELALRMLSRIFVSGRRRDTPIATREGGVADLPDSLARLVRCGRQVDAAVTVLREQSPAYHQSFENSPTSILDDRRRQAVRRDFEDAVIHVARALDGWSRAHAALDETARLRLRSVIAGLPAVDGLLRDFPWLPRQVYQVGHLHFRTDEPEFERRVFALDQALRDVDESLTSAAVPVAYR
ncbi:MAG: hypothetical protein AAF799_44545 [Myxococcota bacterium]